MPGGAAPGVIVLQNIKWPGMHVKINKKGKVEAVSSVCVCVCVCVCVLLSNGILQGTIVPPV